MNRARVIGAIHASAKALGLDDDLYRARLQRIAGKTSCKAMSDAELMKVLDDFNSSSVRPTQRKTTGPSQHLIRRYIALWWNLYWLGEASKPDDHALLEFLKRQNNGEGPDRLQWATPPQISRAIEGLKAWLHRLGVEPKGNDPIDWMRATLLAQWQLLRALDAVYVPLQLIRTYPAHRQLNSFLSGHYHTALNHIDFETASKVMKRLHAWIVKAKNERAS